MLLLAIPMVVFVLHAVLFGSWLMDDAGVSFAYARTLATGHGLVSQPGAPPVEGYSNFLWVLVLAVFFRIGLFHIVWTPKILACALTAGSFLVVTDILWRTTSWGSGVAVGAFIDGTDLRDLKELRVQSPVFAFSVPANGVIPPGACPPLVQPSSSSQFCNPAVSDGVWALLSPLRRGHHIVKFRASTSAGFAVDVTYHLTIAP